MKKPAMFITSRASIELTFLPVAATLTAAIATAMTLAIATATGAVMSALA